MNMLVDAYRFGGGGPPPLTGVVSLLHMDGTDGSTTFTDEVGKTWTAHSSAQIDTAESRFGGASGLFPGGGWIETASSADFGFGTDDFTLEGWYRLPSGGVGGNMTALDTRSGSNAGVGVYMSSTGGIGVADSLAYANNSAVIAVASTPFTQGAFQHWAIVRQGTAVTGYLDGAVVFTTTDSRTLAAAATCFIGDNYVAPSQPLTGHLDEVRITKGTAIYTSAFTPPSSPFTYP